MDMYRHVYLCVHEEKVRAHTHNRSLDVFLRRGSIDIKLSATKVLAPHHAVQFRGDRPHLASGDGGQKLGNEGADGAQGK